MSPFLRLKCRSIQRTANPRYPLRRPLSSPFLFFPLFFSLYSCPPKPHMNACSPSQARAQFPFRFPMLRRGVARIGAHSLPLAQRSPLPSSSPASACRVVTRRFGGGSHTSGPCGTGPHPPYTPFPSLSRPVVSSTLISIRLFLP